MRLINVETKRLENFSGDPTVPYAILSHTWGSEEEELSFQDMQYLDERGAGRSAKLDGTCAQARKDGTKYVWIDTCCIDKANAVELSEAITSMFRWYKKSKMCYTYLSDVTDGEPSQIRASRWFTRGWTLQELLASPRMTFFDSSWRTLGTKSSLSGAIMEATGIPHHILTGIASLDSASIAQKFSWASLRTTTRPEDMAYCLFGIFDIAIPPLYGEGLEAAFERLQEAILKKTHDDSILAWGLPLRDDVEAGTLNEALPPVSGGVLASSPAAFQGCWDIVKREQTDTRIHASETVWGTIPISIRLRGAPSPTGEPDMQVYGLLSCGPKSNASTVIAIPLVRYHGEASGSSSHAPPIYLRPRGSKVIAHEKVTDGQPLERILVCKDRARDQVLSEDKSHWIYIPGPYPWNGTIEEVYPTECYEKETAMIRTPSQLQEYLAKNTTFHAFVRFSYGPRDGGKTPKRFFILALGLNNAQDALQFRALLYFDHSKGSPIPLATIAGMAESLSHSWTMEIHSPFEPRSIQVQAAQEAIAGYPLWAVSFVELPLASKPTIPRGWPEISEQIKLREQNADLVRFLRRGLLVEHRLSLARGETLRFQDEVRAIEESLASVRAEIIKLDALATQLALDLHDKKAKSARCSDMVMQHEDEYETLLEEIEATGCGKDVRKVWSSKLVLQTEDKAVLAAADWELALWRERNGIMTHILKDYPLPPNGGREFPWVPGVTLLMYAAASGDVDFVSEILKYDDDVDATTLDGYTAFDAATWSKNSFAVKALLSERQMERRQRHASPSKIRDVETDKEPGASTRPPEGGQEESGGGPSPSPGQRNSSSHALVVPKTERPVPPRERNGSSSPGEEGEDGHPRRPPPRQTSNRTRGGESSAPPGAPITSEVRQVGGGASSRPDSARSTHTPSSHRSSTGHLRQVYVETSHRSAIDKLLGRRRREGPL